MTRLVVFTDLDGTLLDHETYSMDEARPALKRLKETGTPLIMASSKTRWEIEALREELGVADPFITENGGAVFLPPDCGLEPDRKKVVNLYGYQALILGTPFKEISERFNQLASRVKVRALSSLEIAEVQALTGLNEIQAEAARKREFGEVFILEDPEVSEARLAFEVAELGMRMTRGGRFYHLLGANDKGRAADLLIGLYKKKWPDVVTAAIGDAPNDEPLLAAVDMAYLVARPDGTHSPVYIPRLTKVSKPGPAGFNQAVLSLLDNAKVA